MPIRTFIVDGGNVARKTARLFAIDSGNVARKVKRGFVIDAGGVGRQIYVAAATYSIVTGNSGTQWGWASGVYGSINSVVGLPAGLSIVQTLKSTSAVQSALQVTGFGADPGSNWFNNIQNLTASVTAFSSAATYSFLGGTTAQWIWPTSTALGIPSANGQTENFQINFA